MTIFGQLLDFYRQTTATQMSEDILSGILVTKVLDKTNTLLQALFSILASACIHYATGTTNQQYHNRHRRTPIVWNVWNE